MFTTGVQGIHDKISLEISKEQLVEGYFNRGCLFILSRCVFKDNHLLRRHLIGWECKAMIEYLLIPPVDEYITLLLLACYYRAIIAIWHTEFHPVGMLASARRSRRNMWVILCLIWLLYSQCDRFDDALTCVIFYVMICITMKIRLAYWKNYFL